MTTNYTDLTEPTWTPASLGDGSYDFSAGYNNDNTTNYDDILISGKTTTGTSPTAGGSINVYAAGSVDGGTTYTAGVSGTDGGTPNTGEEGLLPIVVVVEVDATSDHTYEWGPVSLAAVFGGSLPERFAIGEQNNSGVALNSTAGNHSITMIGVKFT